MHRGWHLNLERGEGVCIGAWIETQAPFALTSTETLPGLRIFYLLYLTSLVGCAALCAKHASARVYTCGYPASQGGYSI
jgi:hypothetical protein